MTTETKKRRDYTEDFKRDAVSLVTEQGYKISEAARSLDIGANLIGRWRRQFEDEASGVRLSGEEREELAKPCEVVRSGILLAPRRAPNVLDDAPTDDLLEFAEDAVGDLKDLVEVDTTEEDPNLPEIRADRLRCAHRCPHARSGDRRDREAGLLQRDQDAKVSESPRSAASECESQLCTHEKKAPSARS